MTRYKDFPPGWNHIQIPMTSKLGALAGVAMYTPSTRKGEWAQQAAWAAVSLGGPGLLPGRARHWELPGPEEWQSELVARLTDHVGAFDGYCAYERREARHGLLLLLLRRGIPIAFVKAIEDDEAESTLALDRERTALELVAKASVATFTAPTVVGGGRVGHWSYLALEPLPPRIHRMVDNPPLDMIIGEIQGALGELDHPADTPGHWLPAHGDLTPWNLRDVRNGPRVLIDWEEAGWAPPGADEVLYVASAAAIGRPIAGRTIEAGEAAAYWWDRIQRRIEERRSAGQELGELDHGLVAALRVGRPAGAA